MVEENTGRCTRCNLAGQDQILCISSGTSEAASKYIPVTKELLRSNTVNYLRQLLSLIQL